MENYNIPKYNFNYNVTDVLNSNNNNIYNNMNDSNKKYINENLNLHTNLKYENVKNNYEMKFNSNNSNNPVKNEYNFNYGNNDYKNNYSSLKKNFVDEIFDKQYEYIGEKLKQNQEYRNNLLQNL